MGDSELLQQTWWEEGWLVLGMETQCDERGKKDLSVLFCFLQHETVEGARRQGQSGLRTSLISRNGPDSWLERLEVLLTLSRGRPMLWLLSQVTGSLIWNTTHNAGSVIGEHQWYPVEYGNPGVSWQKPQVPGRNPRCQDYVCKKILFLSSKRSPAKKDSSGDVNIQYSFLPWR